MSAALLSDTDCWSGTAYCAAIDRAMNTASPRS
jgi:hypothetical protein